MVILSGSHALDRATSPCQKDEFRIFGTVMHVGLSARREG
jgi:hypothetical protein